ASLTAEHALQAQAQVTIDRGETKQTFAVIAIREWTGEEPAGTIVTFDDISDLVAAERIAAWADFARRVAHEIKNPLTPIQLSAERIKRKFGPKVGEDSDQLDQMTDVIVRQTNDLRRIVDEFSKFARMPEPDRKHGDLAELMRAAVLLQENGNPHISYVTDIESGPMPVLL
ncbi:MAG: histidine kinase dimerization/phospho-acceptor domain-containing protein, partial [Pseudomonadota bacterium]